jgi:hypothetical protein
MDCDPWLDDDDDVLLSGVGRLKLPSFEDDKDWF